VDKMKDKNDSNEWLLLKRKIRENENWPNQELIVLSATIILGEYTRPGTITSACVQRENRTNKASDASGKFTIE